tara:strand:+ start:2320 stop:3033 length:714 start_codon:yes stop_codon:yes gene_type:complete
MDKNLWERSKAISYVKIGSFFLIGLFLFFLTLISMKKVTFFKGKYEVIVSFQFAEGLRAASPVRFCGVDVGEVSRVAIVDNNNLPVVYVYTDIEKGVNLPEDSQFIINSLSLFGEKYLEIIPPPEPSKYIVEGAIVEGISPIPLFSVFADFSKTMQEIGSFVEEGKLKTSLENSMSNIEDITVSIKGLLEDTKNKSGTIGRLFYDDSLYSSLEEFILDLKSHPWKLFNKPKEPRRSR